MAEQDYKIAAFLQGYRVVGRGTWFGDFGRIAEASKACEMLNSGWQGSNPELRALVAAKNEETGGTVQPVEVASDVTRDARPAYSMVRRSRSRWAVIDRHNQTVGIGSEAEASRLLNRMTFGEQA